MTDVTVIGLGQMGTRLAELLMDAGRRVTVWNRTPEKAGSLEARGASLAREPAAAFAASPITIAILSDYPAVKSLLAQDAVQAALSGKIIVNLGTNSADDASQALALVAAAGGQYLDGAIQAAPSQMGHPNTPILLSGARTAFLESDETLRILGGGIEYLGEAIDAAAYMDLATLSYVYGAFAGFLHGARIAEAKSIDVEAFGRIVRDISRSFGAFFAHEGAVIASGDFTVTESPMRISTVAVQRIAETSAALAINSELPDLVASWLNRAAVAGLENEELAAVIKVLRPDA